MADWAYTPDRGLSRNSAPRIREVRFGDGYSQRAQDGINYMNESWDLSFVNRPLSTILAMEAFLEAKGGNTAFTFGAPGESPEVKVICRSWNVSTINYSGNNATSVASLTATFERVYE